MENLKMVSSEISCRVYVIFIKTFFSSLLKGDSETWRNSFKVSYKIKVFLQQGSPFTHNGHTDKHRRFVSLRTILPLFFSRHVFIVVCPYNVTITFFNRWNQNCHLATRIRSFKMFILLRYILRYVFYWKFVVIITCLKDKGMKIEYAHVFGKPIIFSLRITNFFRILK